MKDSSAGAMNTDTSPVAIWEDKFKNDTLMGRDFREYWKLHVPKYFAPDERTNFLHITFDDAQTQLVFFETLKQFILIENPADTIEHLKELTTPAALCGKVFKMGEATYSCRDCGQDSTCVLCRDCFKASVHQQHRYKMNQSVGGGYCDCGDAEAWREGASCEVHAHSTGGDGGGAASSLAQFPGEIVQRGRAVFAAALDYAHEVLMHENTMDLPHDLRAPPETEVDDEDLLAGAPLFTTPLYATMFYNDETHTFEQVIECLRKAVDCSQRDAVDYATIIDRVGRSIVKCGDFQTCNTAKQVFDTHSTRLNNRPYKVQVMHTHVVAHQTFAMRLLLWLKKLIEEVDGFKALFAQIVNEPAADGPLLDRVMKGDTQLWKQARNQWHLLLIQGMLMENDSKKVFAKTFTRLYPNLMRDFMCDDHNHSDSVISLSVQIYTVPTLAYMLITREDCLSVVTRTFYQECVTRRNAQDVLSFDPRSSDVTWRRINYCLNDLRYLLSVRPSKWDDQLRKGFLFGFNSLLDVLAVMEGMDASVRQTGSHLEYDPEWQTAFTLFGKLSMVICHLIDWCSSDRLVLIKAYRAVLRKLYGKLTAERLRPSCRMELPGRGWVPVIEFDMWSSSVSLHLPLTRMLAGLHLHLGRYGLTFNSSEFDIDNRPTIQQIVETSMRAVILTTQVRAGMWRRNGTSLVSQVHFYSNVRIRSEIQDRDIQVLQIAASLMDADEFIFTLMRRYGVHHWLSSQFEAIMRSQSTDVDGDSLGTYYAQSVQEFTHNLEEFMLVLIHVFGERYQPGVGVVTKENCLKKEIIQSLCIEPTPHSKLCKLVIAENQDVSIEQLAEQVANFRTPSHNTGKGVYEIKPEFLSDYNPFWYHYTREEQSRAEGAQRRRKRLNNEPTCLPPPMLPPFTQEFHNARNIATCRAMVNVIYTVLQRATDLQTRVFSETLVHRTVFFMGMALNKEERDATLSTGYSGSCSGAAAASPTAPSAAGPLDLSFRFSQMARETGIVQLLQELLLSARVSSHADLLGWVLGRLRQLLGGTHGGGGAAGTGGELPEDGREAVVGAAAAAAADDAAAALRRRRNVAAARRARILGQMQAQQNKFIKHNILNSTDDAGQMDAEVTVVASPAAAAAASEGGALVSGSELCGSSMDLTECAGATDDDEWPVCVGPRQTCRSVADDASPAGQFTCILCQATEPLVSAERPALVLAALVQPSTVLSRRRQWSQQQLQQLSSDAAATSMLYLPSDLHRLPHISSCGHAMHAACWKRHFDSVCQRERRRALRLRHNTSFDVSKHEFLCPLCQCLSNTVIPLVPPRLPSPAVQSAAVDNLNVWISGLQLVCTHTVVRMDETWPTSMEPTRVPYCSPSLKTVLKHMSPREGNQFRSQVQLGDRIPEMSNTTREMINTFSMVPFMVGMDTRVEFGDHRIALLTLQSAAYTLHAAEHQLRHSERPLLASLGSRTDICLRQLTRVCAAMLPTVSDLETGQESCVRLLRLLLLTPPPPAAADSTQLPEEPLPTVLDMDAFGCLLLLCSTLTTLFCQHADDVRAPSGSLQELQCLRVCLLLHVVQVLLTVDAAAPTAAVAMDTGDEDADERQWLAELYAMVRSAAGVPVASADPVRLLQLVRTAVTPFLRCCALYFHLLTGVRAPAELLQPLTLPQQLPVLLRYLGLDSLVVGQAIEPHSPVQQLVVRWCGHPQLKRQLLGQAGPLVQYPLSVNTLVPLPIDFSELINKVSDFTCPSSEGESRVPAMCLACGELLCSQSYCCQVQADAIGQIGACNAHLVRCGAGVGLMLRIRECRVHLLVNKVRGANFPPPYVDKFGEVDQGLQRGNPLSLWLEQYERLNRLWMTHSIAEEVTRQMEDTYNQTDWQNL